MNFDDREPFFLSSKEKGAKRISFTVGYEPKVTRFFH